MTELFVINSHVLDIKIDIKTPNLHARDLFCQMRTILIAF